MRRRGPGALTSASSTHPSPPARLRPLAPSRRTGIKLAVVSAASDSAVRRDLRAHGLEQHFDGIHCEVLHKQAMLERYVHRTGAGVVWYVGDTTFDMVQARKAGAIAIGYTGGYDTADALRDAGAHRLIDRLSDLVTHSSLTRIRIIHSDCLDEAG